MAAEWYYTTNKQQMGPVSWDELKQLASSGLLKPNDLVWTEGMAEWVKATRQDGLFADAAAAAGLVQRTDVEEPTTTRRSATRRRIDDELDEHDEADRRERRKARAGGMSTGLKIGLAIGGVLLVLLTLGCVVAIIIGIAIGGWGGGAPPAGVGGNYVVNLPQGTNNERIFTFRAGQRINVTVTTNRNPGPFQPDVDLFVLRRGRILAADQFINPNCNVTFIAPANDTYTVRVINLGPGHATSHVVVNAN